MTDTFKDDLRHYRLSPESAGTLSMVRPFEGRLNVRGRDQAVFASWRIGNCEDAVPEKELHRMAEIKVSDIGVVHYCGPAPMRRYETLQKLLALEEWIVLDVAVWQALRGVHLDGLSLFLRSGPVSNLHFSTLVTDLGGKTYLPQIFYRDTRGKIEWRCDTTRYRAGAKDGFAVIPRSTLS